MSGIAAVLDQHRAASSRHDTAQLLDGMLARLSHRGGDGSRTRCAEGWGLGQCNRVTTPEDRDAAPPRRELSHSLRYQFPGRVLLEHGGLYHSFRNIYYPEGGGLAEATFDVARGDDVEFSRLGVEVQRFRTLFWKERVLALRARLDKVFPAGDGLVPYDDMPTLGGGQRLRGYHRGTFRGEGALLLAAEYRWPVWDTWSASLFWEEGQVFDDFGDLASDGFSSSGGAALTMRTETAFLLSLRLAHSARARTLLGFALEQEF